MILNVGLISNLPICIHDDLISVKSAILKISIGGGGGGCGGGRKQDRDE